MMNIDAHQHFWQYDPARHGWITEQMSRLKRDFMPPDLKVEMDKAGMEACVAVQADQTERETRFLLDLAEEYPYVKGVVGWLDLRADDFEERLVHFMEDSALKGLRHIVQDEPDDNFLLGADFLKGIETVGKYGLAYDILIYSRHLPVAVEFASRFPDQKFVLDHIAKPEIKQQKVDDWEKGIRELAQHPGICCKVSGMVTEADWEHWKADDFKPYLDVVFDAFGPDRLMFGSDWPVCTLAANYQQVFRLLDDYLALLSETARRQIMGRNAEQFYDL